MKPYMRGMLLGLVLLAPALSLGGSSGTVAGGAPIYHSYTTAGAASETIPSGKRLVVIRAWGGGGGGGISGTGFGAGGGGAGAVMIRVALDSTDWGQTMAYSVGAAGVGKACCTAGAGTSGGNSTVTSSGRTFKNLNLVAGGGGFGNATTGGTAGTASGGDTNNAGTAGAAGGAAGVGGTLDDVTQGGGGFGNDSSGAAGNGGAGRIDFQYF